MSFCPNCGIKLQDGDTFCGDCGTRIEGVNNNSQQNTQNPNTQRPSVVVVVPSINTEAVSKHSKQTLAIILNMFTKPMSTIKDLVHALDQKSTIILGVVLALIHGVFSFWKLDQSMAMLGKTLVSLASSMGDVMNSVIGGNLGSLSSSDLFNITGGYNEIKEVLKVPFFNAFLHGVILYAVMIGVLFLGIFVTSKLLSKAKINELSVAKLVILATIPFLGGELSNILFSYLNFSLGMFAFLVGILVSLILIVMNIKEVVDIEDDKLVYGLAVVFSILTACVLFATWKFVLSDMNTIAESLKMM
jgi:uncharacterized Zn finger protein (UPF0148 family)